MPVVSMTGFARAEGQQGAASWAWEVKSVNGKSLDLRFRLAPGFEALEVPVRTSLAERLRRGNVSVSLAVTRQAAGAQAQLRVNRELLAQVVALAREIAAELDAAPPRVDGLLGIRGVLEAGSEEETPEQRERFLETVLASWNETLDALLRARAEEGARLHEVLSTRIDEIAALVGEAEGSAAAQPGAIQARLRTLVAALLEAGAPVPEERLAQEAALLVGRADVREEIDRLTAHVAAARALLAEAAPVGRRLDFLCQEFNREANTLCSKSADLDLTRIGLALKAVIEQFREQVQNIE
ncbi:MAG TPA: YicC/YloC family endoribonuclease [Stellaceae bacterium]